MDFFRIGVNAFLDLDQGYVLVIDKSNKSYIVGVLVDNEIRPIEDTSYIVKLGYKYRPSLIETIKYQIVDDVPLFDGLMPRVLTKPCTGNAENCFERD